MRERVTALILTVLTVLVLPAAAYAQAQTLTAHWDPNPPEDEVTEYEVCLGTSSLACDAEQVTLQSSETSFTFTPVPGVLYYFAVRALSGTSRSAFSSEVNASIPSFVVLPTQRSTINVPITPLIAGVNDPDGAPLQFSHAGLPIGLSLNPTTGRISGTPTASGSYNVTISVFDGLVTAYQTFTWTIGDGTTPALTITSHSWGQTVSSGSVTVTGTATDNGSGGSGIASVTVNGQAASGGAATGNSTASWSRSLTLTSGANVISVLATDGAGNSVTEEITLYVGASGPPSPSMTGASLTPNRPSGQEAGTPVTFSATGTGGRAPYQYRWWIKSENGLWQQLQGWSGTSTYTWTPTEAGNYYVAIWARSAGSNIDQWQAYAERLFVVYPPSTPILQVPTPPTPSAPPGSPIIGASITPNKPSGQTIGAQVTFTASAAGGVAPYEYRWFVRLNGGLWQNLRVWSTSPTLTWTPTYTGNFDIAIWVRSAGSTVDAPQDYAERLFVIYP